MVCFATLILAASSVVNPSASTVVVSLTGLISVVPVAAGEELRLVLVDANGHSRMRTQHVVPHQQQLIVRNDYGVKIYKDGVDKTAALLEPSKCGTLGEKWRCFDLPRGRVYHAYGA